jgi:putative ABC transport system substrate-binding protein
LIQRRQFIALLGVASCSIAPRAAIARKAAGPVIGFLGTASAERLERQIAGFRRGLSEVGFLQDRNVTIAYRWADGDYSRLPHMVAEFLQEPVDLILAQAPPAALAAKAATKTTPIVFIVGLDPVAAGLVASFSRPGGNATGMSLMSTVLVQKRLELLRELVPKASVIAALVNPVSPDSAPEGEEIRKSAPLLGLETKTFDASTMVDLDQAFAAIAQARPDAVLIGTDPFFLVRRREIVQLAARLGLPTIYPFRDFVELGGLISYGTNIPNSYRQAGIYAGRILKGAKPEELPIMQPASFELVINLTTANRLKVDIPPTLHARSDEVIE